MMETWVKEYLDRIRAYAVQPTRARYAATGLLNAVIDGRVEDWRAVCAAAAQTCGIDLKNRAAGDVWWRLMGCPESELDEARAMYLWKDGFDRMYGGGLYQWKCRADEWDDIDHQEPGYWDSRNGDLSQAAVDTEEK